MLFHDKLQFRIYSFSQYIKNSRLLQRIWITKLLYLASLSNFERKTSTSFVNIHSKNVISSQKFFYYLLLNKNLVNKSRRPMKLKEPKILDSTKQKPQVKSVFLTSLVVVMFYQNIYRILIELHSRFPISFSPTLKIYLAN